MKAPSFVPRHELSSSQQNALRLGALLPFNKCEGDVVLRVAQRIHGAPLLEGNHLAQAQALDLDPFAHQTRRIDVRRRFLLQPHAAEAILRRHSDSEERCSAYRRGRLEFFPRNSDAKRAHHVPFSPTLGFD